MKKSWMFDKKQKLFTIGKPSRKKSRGSFFSFGGSRRKRKRGGYFTL